MALEQCYYIDEISNHVMHILYQLLYVDLAALKQQSKPY